MQLSRSTNKAVDERYWQGRAQDAERQLACATTESLRTVYLELVGHYTRMADLYGTTPVFFNQPAEKQNF